MKAFRIWAVVCALGLGACGDDGTVQSPDFTPQLLRIVVNPTTTSAALGQTVQFTAVGYFTTPPESDVDETSAALSEVSWSVDAPSLASVSDSGLVMTTGQGRVMVSAAADGKEGSAQLDIGAPGLVELIIEPSSATIPLGTQQTFSAKGRFTDSSTPRNVDTTVTWSPTDDPVASVSPATGAVTVATAQSLGQMTLVASTTPSGSQTPLTANALVNVTEAELDRLLRVEPSPAAVAKGNAIEFFAIGEFSNGDEQAIADDQVDWTSADEATATVDENGIATGVEIGQTTITATIKDGVAINDPAQNTADAELSVTFSGCNVPLRAASGATVAQGWDALCLLCDVSDEAYIIDEDNGNYGELQVPVGLLTAKAWVDVGANQQFEAGTPAGFIVGRPVGQLVNAEIISQLQVQPLLNGVPTGDSTSTLYPLGLALLGLNIPIPGNPFESELALINIPAEAVTQPYDGIRLTFNSGIASALSRIQVYAACGDAVLPEAAE